MVIGEICKYFLWFDLSFARIENNCKLLQILWKMAVFLWLHWLHYEHHKFGGSENYLPDCLEHQ